MASNSLQRFQVLYALSPIDPHDRPSTPTLEIIEPTNKEVLKVNEEQFTLPTISISSLVRGPTAVELNRKREETISEQENFQLNSKIEEIIKVAEENNISVQELLARVRQAMYLNP